MKRGPLTKPEKSYIKKYRVKLTVDAMANHLERSFKTVEKYCTELALEEAQAAIQEGAVKVTPDRPTALDLMGRNKKFGAVTMTEAASMSADETSKSRNIAASSRYKNCIHQIRKSRE